MSDDAAQVIHQLLDAEVDAFSPAARLDEEDGSRCPECSGTNLSEPDEDGLIDCLGCGIWFNPDAPENTAEYPEKPVQIAVNDPRLPVDARPDSARDAKTYSERATPFPAIKLLDYGHKLDIADGRHRLTAARMRGDKTIAALLGRPKLKENLSDEIEDIKAYSMLHGAPLNPRVTITFSLVTPESAADGSESENGWEDQDGVPMEPDDYATLADKTVEFLQNAGAGEPSSSHFHPGVWYSTGYNIIDYGTGEEEQRSFHLVDYTKEEEKEVWDRYHDRG